MITWNVILQVITHSIYIIILQYVVKTVNSNYIMLSTWTLTHQDTKQRAPVYPSHPPVWLPMTIRLRRVSSSMSRATCLNNAPYRGVNNMKFQDDFRNPLQGYLKLVSAMPHSVLRYFILLPWARPSVERKNLGNTRL